MMLLKPWKYQHLQKRNACGCSAVTWGTTPLQGEQQKVRKSLYFQGFSNMLHALLHFDKESVAKTLGISTFAKKVLLWLQRGDATDHRAAARATHILQILIFPLVPATFWDEAQAAREPRQPSNSLWMRK